MTANPTYLKESASNKLVRASLFDEVADQHLAMWRTTWCPAMAKHRAGRVTQGNPEDSHWDWQGKANQWRRLLGYHSFAIVCRHELQGLMLANDLKAARLSEQFNKPIVYVDYLATAPWNRTAVQIPPRYRGVGSVFMAVAIQLSLDMNYRGRIGLHALPAAEPFYQNTCGMTALGRDMTCQNLMYYEMTEAQAMLFHGDRAT